MKKSLLSLIFIAGGISPLFSMEKTKQEEEDITARVLNFLEQENKEDEEMETLRLEKEKAELAKEKAEEKAKALEDEELEMYTKDYRTYKAQQVKRIEAQRSEETKLYVQNDSKWNAKIRYSIDDNKKQKELSADIVKEELSKELDRKAEIKDQEEIAEIDKITSLDIIPSSSYWQKEKNLKKIKIKDLSKQIKKVRSLHPNKSVQITITIPKLPGGKFKGFAFNIEPAHIKSFKMTLQEYIKLRKAGKLGPPTEA